MSVEQFIALGMTADDAESRVALLDRTAEGFVGRFGRPPEWQWFVPGRIEMFGKHTDYAGGRSLLAAVPRGFAVAASGRPGRVVRVFDTGDGSTRDVWLSSSAPARGGWGAYADVVVRRLARNFPGAALGADIAIRSDLPRAAGLSSSSALVVGIATALSRCGNLVERDDWRRDIQTVEDLATYLGCVENGSAYRGLAGTAGVGTQGGSEDHTAILTCQAGALSQYRYVPVTHIGDTPFPSRWTFVVASTGVHAGKAGRVKDQYNRASHAVTALLTCWNTAAGAPAASLAAALTAPGAVERLCALVRHSRPDGFTAAELERRLAHFVAEDARVPQAARAVAAVDGAALAALADDSQQQADEWLGNQIPETRTLAALAREHGAVAASSFGAGFGGSVWAVVKADAAAHFAADWTAAYQRRFPGRRAECFIGQPGPARAERRTKSEERKTERGT